MDRLTKYSNDLIRNRAVNILRKLDSKNRLDGDELALISSFCLIERVENKQLKEYEDLEEQGKLLKLPCAVGDTVYRINKGAKESIIPMKVCEVGVISLKVGGFVIQIMCRDASDNGETYYLSTNFGKTVFLTREKAEAALEELREDGTCRT